MNYKKLEKRKFILIASVLIAVIVIASVLLMRLSGNKEGYRTISVVEVSGQVAVTKDGIEYRAYPGMLLQEGHEIITGGNSYARLVLDDDKYVKLESGSKVVFETLGSLGNPKTRMTLERGGLTSELVNPLEADGEFVVNIPNAVLAVRGTFFRVDLNVEENGEISSDVMTYGGKVASQRVMPDGEVINEEVMIDAGYKAVINMTQEDTHYIVETETGETVIVDLMSAGNVTDDGKTVLPTRPIFVEDIPDEDLVDVYFAAINGHKVFLSVEEIERDIVERQIAIEEYTPIYEKAQELKVDQEKNQELSGSSNTTSSTILANDSKPLARVEEREGMEDDAVVSSNTTANNSGLIDGVHVHSERTTTVDATCTTPGSKEVTCRNCKEVISFIEVPVKGHSYGEWEVIANATCTSEGSKKHSCTWCGLTETETIATLGHAYANEFTIDAPASCASVGSKSKHCARCESVSEVTEIPMTGHSYGVWEITQIATCTSEGSRMHSCIWCGFIETEMIAALGHAYANEFTIDTPASCTRVGSKSKHCARCESVSEVTEIPVAGHSYGTWITTASATCESAGMRVRSCVSCGYNEEETLSALGHAYASEFTIDMPATCTTVGSKSKHCSRCESTSEVTEIPMTGHSYGTWITTTEATCENTGERIRSCVGCGHNDEETLIALGHAYASDFTIDTPATCTVVGSKSKHCSRCESTNEVTEIAATGHNYSERREEPSAIEIGRLYEYCTKCQDVANEQNLYGEYSFYDRIFFSTLLRYDTDYDNALSETEIAEITTLELEQYAGYTDLDGIQLLTSLTSLSVHASGIMSMDLSQNTELITLDISEAHGITSLDLSANTKLETLDISQSGISAINQITIAEEAPLKEFAMTSTIINFDEGDLSWFDKLTRFTANYAFISNNDWAKIEAALPSDLQKLHLSGNSSAQDASEYLSGDLDFTKFANLEDLQLIWNSDISSVDVSGCTALKSLHLQGCRGIADVDLTQNNELKELVLTSTGTTSLNLSTKTALEKLEVNDCSGLSALDVTACNGLKVLACRNTAITTLDLSQNAALTSLNIAGTNITDISAVGWENLWGLTVLDAKNANLDDADWSAIANNLPAPEYLNDLRISQNPDITSLGLGPYPELRQLEIAELTGLYSVELSGCQWLDYLDISGSGLTSLNLVGNPNLNRLYMNNLTGIQNLDVSNQTVLSDLQVSGCSQLTSINVSGCTSLWLLVASDNPVLSTINAENAGLGNLDITNCPSLLTVETGGRGDSINITKDPDSTVTIN